jgi:hypothetical protein
MHPVCLQLQLLNVLQQLLQLSHHLSEGGPLGGVLLPALLS